MKPYYSRAGITLYHGDCREVLPTLGRFDAVVTDPPYGIGDAPIQGQVRTGKRVGGENTWHPDSEWDAAIDPAWCRLVCSAAPVVAWFGQWRKRPEVESAMTYPIRCEIVWAKDCHVGPPHPVASKDERLWLFSEKGIEPKRFDTTVWSVPIIPTWAHKDHKNEKPVPLMQRAIALLVSSGQRICDPFSGSGTTLVAALRCGVEAVGVELKEEHCASASKRLDRELAQGDLFVKREASP